MEQLNTTINHATLSYNIKPGQDSDLTVVFIHGFPFDKTIWEKQLLALPPKVAGLAYDIRGFGSSSTDHNFFSIDLFAKDLIQMLDVLKLEKCVLCGISMGGYIALRAVELAPEKIGGLVLADTNSIADANENKLKRFASIELINNAGKEEFTERFIENVFSEQTLLNKPQTVNYLQRIIRGTSNETICAAQLALASRTDTTHVLKEIAVPTLVLRGAEDKLMTIEQAQQLHQGIAHAEFAEISNAGHLPNLEEPEAFNAILNQFLSKHFLV